jgi:hypothetical protein
MAGKVHDRKRLVVDRDPTKQLAVEVGRFKELSPIDMVAAFAQSLEDYGLEALEDVTGLDLTALKDALDRLRELLGGVNLFDPDNWSVDNAIEQFIGSIPDGMLGANWGELYERLRGAPAPEEALDALADFFKAQLGGLIPSWRLPVLPLSHIRNVNPNLLPDPSFDDEATLAGLLDWDWDDTDGRTRPGCAYTMADGTTHILHSAPIEVGPDDTLDLEIWAKWTGLVTSGAGPVRCNIAAYRPDHSLIGGGPAVLAVGGANGDSAGWVKLSTVNWPVPDDAEYVVLEPTVAAWATAGAVRFDDGRLAKSGALPQNYVNGLVSALQDGIARVQSVIDQVWTGITRQVLDGPKNLADLFEVLGAIPAGNVGGVGGLSSIGETITETWNQLWGGFARGIGSNKSIADAANAASVVADVADQAVQVGEWNNAILGIRDNKPLDSGMDPTAVSMFPIPDATASNGEPLYLNATAASVPMAFWIATEDAQRGSIQWLGKGNANMTAFYVDVYRLDKATGAATLIHTSPDLLPQLSAGLKLIRYDMQAAARVSVAHGDVLGFAWRVQGAGTHQIGARYGLAVGDPTQVPQRPSAVRTGTLVGNMAAGTIPYGGDVPWVAFGIVTGDVAPPFYAPRTTEYSLPGSGIVYDIPTWAKYLDVVLLGGAGGGKGGNGGDTRPGYGGAAGVWQTETLVRGVDFPQNATQIVFDVGAGGAGGAKEQNGKSGTPSTRRAIAGGKAALTAAAGAGATQYGSGTDPMSTGRSPGSIVYNGRNYVGGSGGAGGRPGANGGAPGAGGGGGYGGIYTVAYAGGDGARGNAWVTARST